MFTTRFFGVLFLLGWVSAIGQSLVGPELLEKAIAFHDPNGNWNSFQGKLEITMERPNASKRVSHISMDLPGQLFSLEVQKDNDNYGYYFQKDSCMLLLNGSSKITEEERQKFRLSCERGRTMQNYYTYLYGLPMKLRDPGTKIDQQVQHRNFKGKDYLVLKVNYEEAVGKDTWYFYFDPDTYAMEVYQFFHDESKNDGEFILLKDLEEINGIKMPKIREWYYNSDGSFLATDILAQWHE